MDGRITGASGVRGIRWTPACILRSVGFRPLPANMRIVAGGCKPRRTSELYIPDMPRFRYVTADVFTDEPFGGNQLAVFPEAAGIPEHRLQDVAREFNFSETTFVFPP